ncbi:MAG: redox-regulated ATPase YchF [Acidobacteriota bacterium]
MKVGIFGLPLSGKTTLFELLTSTHVTATGKRDVPNLAVLKVPDARLDRLSAMFEPKKTTPATIECVDVTGLSKGEMSEAQGTTQLREVDALAHVVRAFPDETVPHVETTIDPLRDVKTMELELLLADMDAIGKRLPRLEKNVKRGVASDKAEQELLTKLQGFLEKEIPLREVELTDDEQKRLKGFGMLSLKPLIHVVSLGESQAAQARDVASAFGLQEIARKKGTAVCGVMGKVEREIADLDAAEREAFRSELGVDEPLVDKFLRISYSLLGLISFFTVGKDECRAWTIPKGIGAQRAAGRIHSDLERGFIRAEVISYDDFIAAGSMNRAKELATLRLEGKDYVVADGDIMNIRFSV